MGCELSVRARVDHQRVGARLCVVRQAATKSQVLISCSSVMCTDCMVNMPRPLFVSPLLPTILLAKMPAALCVHVCMCAAGPHPGLWQRFRLGGRRRQQRERHAGLWQRLCRRRRHSERRRLWLWAQLGRLWLRLRRQQQQRRRHACLWHAGPFVGHAQHRRRAGPAAGRPAAAPGVWLWRMHNHMLVTALQSICPMS